MTKVVFKKVIPIFYCARIYFGSTKLKHLLKAFFISDCITVYGHGLLIEKYVYIFYILEGRKILMISCYHNLPLIPTPVILNMI